MTEWSQKISEVLGPEGSLQELLSGFVYRREQLNLAQAIAENFERQEFLLAEVGTGVGKTFAYLLPAFLLADSEGEKVVISTRTKALQEQIVKKDLPLLLSAIDTNAKTAVAVGRENFMCWYKYVNLIAGNRRLEPEEAEFIDAIRPWAEETRQGNRNELEFGQGLMQYWRLVAAERHTCLKENCTYHRRCFRLKMAKEVNQADIIITNHALLLSDVLSDSKLLPEYKYLILDEAHNFSKEVFERLSLQFSRPTLGNSLNRLYHKVGRKERGILCSAAGKVPELAETIIDLTESILMINAFLEECFEKLNLLIKVPVVETGGSLVLEKEMLDGKDFLQVMKAFSDWQQALIFFLQKFNLLLEEMEVKEPELGQQLRNEKNVLHDLMDEAFQVMEEQIYRPETIGWLNYRNGKVQGVTVSVLGSSTLLEKRLYGKLDSLVMLSASLTIADDFSAFIEQNALEVFKEEKALNTLIEKSPFDWLNNSGVYVPVDMPEPHERHFLENSLKLLSEGLFERKVPTLLLFTSKKQLKAAAEYLRPLTIAEGFNLLVQHEDGEYQTLLNRFINEPGSILMGVETFWEGIDIKGEHLKLLVMIKLPFRSPDDPYCRAWEKHYQQSGKSAFYAFMLPEAILRFKQGIGRLIRSEHDRGAVIILDKRLFSKNYGKLFIKSLPQGLVKAVTCEQLWEEVSPWLS